MRLFFILLGITLSTLAMAQKSVIEGVVKDESTGETLIGANIVFADNPSRGTAANIDGYFKLEVQPGTYKLVVSYIGYKSKTITATAGGPQIEITLKSEMLDEIEIVADVAIDRKTPVAFMNIKASKITEELAGRDLPMLLNTTPGVYATAQGGGEGDAEIRMRGFGATFVGVLLDGIPVNDMENGRVYWSNWFGLNSMTRSMQVQRGLGSSKLAIPSVGGTVNILTKGIDNKKEIRINQGIDQFGKSTTEVGYNSGQLKNGWSLTMAGSYKFGDSWVDEMYTKAYFYFVKVNKRIKNHTLSFTTYGAPQEHIQRSGQLRIASFDLDYAIEQGADTSYAPRINDMGIDYNRNYGYIRRTRFNENAGKEILHLNVNNYYKPMFYVKDFWNVNDKINVYNIAYLSIGMGGGVTGVDEQNTTGATVDYDPITGQANLQGFYDANTLGGFIGTPIDPNYSDTEYRSRFIIGEMRNDHIWYGYLGNISYEHSQELSFDVGLDMRHYEGSHYDLVKDLLGGDYFINEDDLRIDYDANPKAAMRRVGDKYSKFYTNFATWGGSYFQAEYSTPLYSALLNVTGSMVQYHQENYFEDKNSDKRLFKGWTIKGGFNYNLTENINAFVNAGYYDKVQMMTFVLNRFTVDFNDAIDNEKIKSFEVGFQYKTSIFSTRLNGYFTKWEETPRNIRAGDDDYTSYSVYAGMDALHKGIELDFTLKPVKQLEVQGWLSLGDWKWDKKHENLALYNQQEIEPYYLTFDATGIYVGDAAQTQLGGKIRYEPIKGLYGSLTATYFNRYYSDFQPGSILDENNNPVQSWQIPAYTLFDFHAGYKFDFPWYKKIKLKVGLSVLNIFDELYISDAQNNADFTGAPTTPSTFDATSATVFFGPPRRFMANLAIYF
jgi:iron complex outermembrane receptor protein